MPVEYNVVIADTTCFIILSKIDKLQILKQLFTTITTTETVAKEFGQPLPTWIIIHSEKDTYYKDILEVEVDKGEASAIALAFEFEKPLLILDDLKARKLAEKLHLNYIGTFGILLKAKEIGVIEAIKPLLKEIQLTNFRFSESMLKEILSIAGE